VRTGDYAWVGLAAGVLVYDVCCPKGEMLSEASARYSSTPRRAPRAAWYTTVVYIAGHLMHVWGPYDPLTRIATAFDR
jgi:hypothetical protein